MRCALLASLRRLDALTRTVDVRARRRTRHPPTTSRVLCLCTPHPHRHVPSHPRSRRECQLLRDVIVRRSHARPRVRHPHRLHRAAHPVVRHLPSRVTHRMISISHPMVLMLLMHPLHIPPCRLCTHVRRVRQRRINMRLVGCLPRPPHHVHPHPHPTRPHSHRLPHHPILVVHPHIAPRHRRRCARHRHHPLRVTRALVTIKLTRMPTIL